MARTWLSIRVDLIGGMHALDLWPRPGRLLLARPGMTFRQLAEAINDAFARWDRSHLHVFTFEDGARVGIRGPWDEDDGELDDTEVTLSRLALGERFAFEYDLGDSWMHLCTVGDAKVDPREVYGDPPDRPAAYFGWGVIPDQYGRRWDGDDGSSTVPPQPDPPLSDLPDLHYTWGGRAIPLPPPDTVGPSFGHPDAEGDVIAGPWSGSLRALTSEPAMPSWTRAEVGELRGAVHRREVSTIMELVSTHPTLDVAHLAAPGLLSAAEEGHDPARMLLVPLIDELSERGWTGDDELADEIVRVVMGAPSDLRPVHVDLDELASHLDAPTDVAEGWKLELTTGRFWPLDPVGMVGEEEPEGFDDPDRFVGVMGLGSRVGYGDMRDFIASLDDEQMVDRLRRAIDGRGAFRRFKHVLADDEVARDDWLRFSGERWLARARWWLADDGLRPSTDGAS